MAAMAEFLRDYCKLQAEETPGIAISQPTPANVELEAVLHGDKNVYWGVIG